MEAMNNWPEPKSIRDIQIFLGFANFYWRFIQSFGKIAGPPPSMLQTIGSLKNLPLSIDMSKRNEFDIVGSGDDYKDETVERLPSKNLNGAIDYLTSKTMLTFTKLRKVFTKALVLQHFDPEWHIHIKTDVSGYAISRVLS